MFGLSNARHTDRQQIDAHARHNIAPRTHVPHHCLGTDTCAQCAEMREAHRREERWALARLTPGPVRTGDTTRGGW
jgi:hypothetical protein